MYVVTIFISIETAFDLIHFVSIEEHTVEIPSKEHKIE